jgi:NADPH-dependent glutamate synthase beta subunit-like oxidoreductase
VWLGDIDPKSPDYQFSRQHKGQNISIKQLQDRYSAVILAHGAVNDRHLGLEHELTADGILPSRRVVNWYNGSLDDDLDVSREFDLRNSKNITVIGNGNIFCDISRTLLKDPEELAKTDMPSSVVDLLRESTL